MQQRTAEQIEDASQFLKVAVEMARSVSHKRVQQHTAERIFQLSWYCMTLQGVEGRQNMAGCNEGIPSPCLQVENEQSPTVFQSEEGMQSLIFSGRRRSSTGEVSLCRGSQTRRHGVVNHIPKQKTQWQRRTPTSSRRNELLRSDLTEAEHVVVETTFPWIEGTHREPSITKGATLSSDVVRKPETSHVVVS